MSTLFETHPAYMGIDNGTTGTIGWLRYDPASQLYTPNVIHTPTKSEPNYQKEATRITRIDHEHLVQILTFILSKVPRLKIVIERPFIAPNRFKQIESGMRALEATLVSLEIAAKTFPSVLITRRYTDARAWRKILGIKGVRDEVKRNSIIYIQRHFPKVFGLSLKDYDGLLIAYAELCKDGGTLVDVEGTEVI